VIFNNASASNYMQIINMATHWIDWSLSLLLPEDQRDHMVTECNHLLTLTRDF
jgi:hypothetical protein